MRFFGVYRRACPHAMFPVRLLQSVGGLSVQHVVSNYDVLRTAKHNTVYETKGRGNLVRVSSDYRYELQPGGD
jgi:hypothetical protein